MCIHGAKRVNSVRCELHMIWASKWMRAPTVELRIGSFCHHLSSLSKPPKRRMSPPNLSSPSQTSIAVIGPKMPVSQTNQHVGGSFLTRVGILWRSIRSSVTTKNRDCCILRVLLRRINLRSEVTAHASFANCGIHQQ
jgi:hypothetical protein